MTEKISAIRARQGLGDLLNRVALRQDEFIIERAGKALAAVVPLSRLEQLRAAARLRLGDILKKNQAANRTQSGKESTREIQEAIGAVRTARTSRS